MAALIDTINLTVQATDFLIFSTYCNSKYVS